MGMRRAAAQTAAAVLEEEMPLHPAACKNSALSMHGAMQDNGLPHVLARCVALRVFQRCLQSDPSRLSPDAIQDQDWCQMVP